MSAPIPSREAAWALLCEHNDTSRSLRHARAVEQVMRFMARRHGEDEEAWGIVGLLHDLDWEKYPQEHCARVEVLMKEAGWPPLYIRAVVSHGWQICSDVEPLSLMERTLYAVDELAGFIYAAALVRPNRAIHGMKLKSLKKKWKSKHFAAGVDRRIVERGAERLDVSLDHLMLLTLEAMQEISSELGLS